MTPSYWREPSRTGATNYVCLYSLPVFNPAKGQVVYPALAPAIDGSPSSLHAEELTAEYYNLLSLVQSEEVPVEWMEQFKQRLAED